MHQICIIADETTFLRHDNLRVGDLVTAYIFGSVRTIKPHNIKIIYQIVFANANTIIAVPKGKEFSLDFITASFVDAFGQDLQFEAARQHEIENYSMWTTQLVAEGELRPANLLKIIVIHKKTESCR